MTGPEHRWRKRLDARAERRKERRVIAAAADWVVYGGLGDTAGLYQSDFGETYVVPNKLHDRKEAV